MNSKQQQPIHADPDFRDLLLEVSAASNGRISPAFIEKDYWVTRTLASLVATGLDIWFKGGTALGKGFDAIQRFSENLDLKIQGTAACPLPEVASWTSQGKKATAERRDFFGALKERLSAIRISPDFSIVQDAPMRGANIECSYPGEFKDRLSQPFKQFILLEVGHALVTLFVERRISSSRKWLDRYDDPSPIVRCIPGKEKQLSACGLTTTGQLVQRFLLNPKAFRFTLGDCPRANDSRN